MSYILSYIMLYCLLSRFWLPAESRLQRSQELSEAITSIKHQWQPSCLTHRDLKLDNVILDKNWQTSASIESTPLIKIIDWELFVWGDPLFDVGTLLGSYLMLWLETLVVAPGVSMEQSLRLAETPLERVQPILVTILKTYFQAWPELLDKRKDASQVIFRYAGFHIFQRIVHRLSRHEAFNQKSLCTLQIVKRLLCEPEFSFSHILGISPSEFSEWEGKFESDE